MRAFAVAWIAVAGLAQFSHAIGADMTALAALALALSALWILVGMRTTSRATAFLTGFAVLAAASASSGDGFLLPTVAATAALFGWDACLAARRLVGFTREGRRRIAVRYGTMSAAVAAASIGLVAAGGFLRIPLSFGAAVALSVGLLALATTIGLLSRPGSPKPAGQAETPSSASANEKAGRHLSPDPDPSSD
ncbi:hypothetical protein ACFLTM_00565 [Candidatus Bipolaricaulota bacterium]